MAKNSTGSSSSLQPRRPGPEKSAGERLASPAVVLADAVLSGRRALHFARGGRAGDVGLEVLHRREGVARVLHVVLVLGIDLLPLGDPQPLLRLGAVLRLLG